MAYRKNYKRGKGKGKFGDAGSERKPAVKGSLLPALPILPSRRYIQVDPAKAEDLSPGSALLRAHIMIVPPKDYDEANMTKAVVEWYARLRAMNAGAINYSPEYLASYVYAVRTVRALFVQACVAWQATHVKLMDYSDYPYAAHQLCGCSDYVGAAGSLADDYNRMKIIAQDIDLLPVIPIELYDRDVEILGTVVKESRSGRSSYIAPILDRVATPIWNGEVWTVNTGSYGVSATRLSDLLAGAVSRLKDLNANKVFAILRGDIMKAFGSMAYKPTMKAFLDGGLRIADDDKYRSMYHNGTLFGTTGSSVVVNAPSGTTNPEFNCTISTPVKIPMLTDLWEGDIATITPESFDWATRLAPFVRVQGDNFAIYSRGHVMTDIDALVALAPDTSATAETFRSLIGWSQNDSIQSTALRAAAKLGTWCTLAGALLPKILIYYQSNMQYMTWAKDNPFSINMADYKTDIEAYIRASLNVTPPVYSKTMRENV
jgi:hypothetical protein